MITLFLIIALVISAATVLPGLAACVDAGNWREFGRIVFTGSLLVVSIVVLYLN